VVKEISGGHQEQLLATSTGGGGRGSAEMDVLFTNREVAFRRALIFCSKTRAGIPREAAVRAKEVRRRCRPIRRCLCAEGWSPPQLVLLF